MTAKEQKIKEAWIEAVGEARYKEVIVFIDENGYLPEEHAPLNADIYFEMDERKGGWLYYRPEKLTGIEHNNGWFRTDKRMPDAEGDGFIVYTDNSECLDAYYTGTQFAFKGWTDSDVKATHWRPKTEYPLPIY